MSFQHTLSYYGQCQSYRHLCCTIPLLALHWLPERTEVCYFQAYDITMDENKPLRTYEEQEICKDPLVVLGCGHVLPMTSVDGYMDLRRAYTTDGQGKWQQPCHLPVRQLSCNMCQVWVAIKLKLCLKSQVTRALF